ncbi:response regulator [Magnetococcus sp. PR-3]|uniref:response regulator n=1 Tax=Magnetococcus sp. PR-3 TaxID=3120355 RepID=UPI002FCE26FB
MEHASKILLIEDSESFVKLMSIKIQKRGYALEVAGSKAEAEQLLAQDAQRFFITIVDMQLPDALDGEMVDYTLSKGIPSVVFAGTFDAEMRAQMWRKKVVDYVIKDSPASVAYVVDLCERLDRNRSTKVLVVDDSKSARYLLSTLLKIHNFQVFQAVDGEQALAVYQEHPDIRLILTDYNMPNLDGFGLIKKLRAKISRRTLAIIGVTASNDPVLSAKFIKFGANDYLKKPFSAEEFYCRIHLNIEMVEQTEVGSM